MQSFDPTGRYGADTVIAALQGRTGSRTIDFRYELLNRSNYRKADLIGVVAASVSQDASADVKRTASFTIREGYDSIDWLSDRIKPWVRLLMPDGGWVEWPQGVFLLSSPDRNYGADESIIRTVTAYDQLVVLTQDKVTDRFSIPAGTLYTSAVANVAAVAGIVARITASNLALPVTWDYEAGTSRLTIITDLLSALNYRSAWFDETGTLVCEPYVLPGNRDATYAYNTDAQSVIVGDIGQSIDLFDVPNSWTLVVSDTDRGSFSSTYVNTNPGSPTSTVNRGRKIVVFEDGQTAADQATLDQLVRKRAFEDSQVYESETFTTALMPFHSNADVVSMTVPAMGLNGDKCEELSWSMDLRVGGGMAHTVRRVINVGL